MLKYALIGYGGMARSIIDILKKDSTTSCQCVSVLVRRPAEHDPEAGLTFVASIADLLATAPDIVLECAGHEAVKDYAGMILQQGINFAPASIGALADQALFDDLYATAKKSGARLILSAGAIGGIDALAAARESGLDYVLYRGRKPALAWQDTPAAQKYDLNAITKPEVHFRGTAREAARLYPKNANVAAIVALAGMGFDDTQVELIAEPAGAENIHELDVKAKTGTFSIRLQGHPSDANPKTSMLAIYGLARLVQNMDRTVVF